MANPRSKRINTNPLSHCALDHRPYNEKSRAEYREVQERILRTNAVREYGPSAQGDSIEMLAGFTGHDVDLGFGKMRNSALQELSDEAAADQLHKIIAELARIRIQDANGV